MRALGVLLVSCLESFKPVAWYATPLTNHDLRKFKVSVGSSKHNTTWEALALLVAGAAMTARYADLGARQV